MRICYALLIHKDFHQVLQLIRRLDAPDVRFVIHVDAKVPRREYQDLSDGLTATRIDFSKRVRVRWGGYSQAAAIASVLRTAHDGKPFDRCVLLSGQDYPVRSHAEICAYFAAHPKDEFVEVHALDALNPDESHWTPFYRFRRHHLFLGKRHRAVPFVVKPPPPVPLYHGSCWWSLTSEAVAYLAERFATDRRLMRYLRTGLLVDEVVVQTMLMDSPFASRLTGSSTTYVNFTPSSGPHPKMLELHDIETVRNSGRPFARKVDPIGAPEVIRELDRLAALAGQALAA